MINTLSIILQASTPQWGSVLIGFAVVVVIFLLIRFIILWYWRINEMVENQDRQISTLEMILQELKRQNEEKKLD